MNWKTAFFCLLMLLPGVVLQAQVPSGKIVFSSDRGGNTDIYVMTAGGNNVTRLTHHWGEHFWPAFSRDGKRIAFISIRENPYVRDLYLMNADGTGLLQLTHTREPLPGEDPPGAIGPEAPAFHPQGHQLIFSEYGELYLIGTNTNSIATQIVIAGGSHITLKEEPVFSPDGSKIAFAGWTETEIEPGSGIFEINSDIYVANVNGSGLVRLTTHPGWDTTPSFSHDGTRIVFSRQDDPTAGIYVIRSTGGTATKLTGTGDRSFLAPCFSPDDLKIAFNGTSIDYDYEVYTMNTNGTGIVRLTSDPAEDMDPSWAPGTVPPALAVQIPNPRIKEGNAGTTNLAVNVTLSSAHTQTVSVILSTLNGSALADQDFIGTTQTVVFTPGQISKTLNIVVTGDTLHESQESFTVQLSAPVNSLISQPRASAFIINDDPIPPAIGRLAFSAPAEDGVIDIFLMERDGSATYNLTDTPELDELAPAWSPNGSKIAFISTEWGELSDLEVINSDGTARTNLTRSASRSEYNPSWSPDNSKLLFEASDATTGFNFGLFIMNANGTGLTPLNTAPSYWPNPHRNPVWSPKGKIYFLTAGTENWTLRSIDPNGANERTLLTATGYWEMLSSPALSPDGSKLVLSAAITNEFDVQYDILLMNADGTGLTNLTQHPADDYDPTFTPDGTAVMFSSPREGAVRLFTVPVPGATAPSLATAAPAPATPWATNFVDVRGADWDKRQVILPRLGFALTNETAGSKSLRLQFTALSNTTYSVQYRTALATAPWQKLTNILVQSVTTNVLAVDSIPAGAAQRFYRVVSPAVP